MFESEHNPQTTARPNVGGVGIRTFDFYVSPHIGNVRTITQRGRTVDEARSKVKLDPEDTIVSVNERPQPYR